jgi:hypothetical protein
MPVILMGKMPMLLQGTKRHEGNIIRAANVHKNRLEYRVYAVLDRTEAEGPPNAEFCWNFT